MVFSPQSFKFHYQCQAVIEKRSNIARETIFQVFVWYNNRFHVTGTILSFLKYICHICIMSVLPAMFWIWFVPSKTHVDI